MRRESADVGRLAAWPSSIDDFVELVRAKQ
jgi:hypothetical protein